MIFCISYIKRDCRNPYQRKYKHYVLLTKLRCTDKQWHPYTVVFSKYEYCHNWNAFLHWKYQKGCIILLTGDAFRESNPMPNPYLLPSRQSTHSSVLYIVNPILSTYSSPVLPIVHSLLPALCYSLPSPFQRGWTSRLQTRPFSLLHLQTSTRGALQIGRTPVSTLSLNGLPHAPPSSSLEPLGYVWPAAFVLPVLM